LRSGATIVIHRTITNQRTTFRLRRSRPANYTTCDLLFRRFLGTTSLIGFSCNAAPKADRLSNTAAPQAPPHQLGRLAAAGVSAQITILHLPFLGLLGTKVMLASRGPTRISARRVHRNAACGFLHRSHLQVSTRHGKTTIIRTQTFAKVIAYLRHIEAVAKDRTGQNGRNRKF